VPFASWLSESREAAAPRWRGITSGTKKSIAASALALIVDFLRPEERSSSPMCYSPTRRTAMTAPEQNKQVIQEGQKGGPGQKNRNAQGAFGAEQERNSRSGVQNPGQTGSPGGRGKQDAPQNQKR
jgi:hypothetical protein